MKRTRIKKWLHGGKPGKQSPMQVSCGRGHQIWVSVAGPKRCPYCRGKKQYKEAE